MYTGFRLEKGFTQSLELRVQGCSTHTNKRSENISYRVVPFLSRACFRFGL